MRPAKILLAISICFPLLSTGAFGQTGVNQDLWQDVRFVWELRAHAIANPFGDRLVVAGQYRVDMEARVWISDDRGATWRQVESGTEPNCEWKSMQFLQGNPSVGWLGGGTWVSGKSTVPTYARVMKTVDGGETWESKLELETVGRIIDIDFLNEQEGLAVGYYGIMHRTEDGGQTWESFSVGPDNFTGCRWEGPGVVWALNRFGAVYRSTDSGREGTWEMIWGPATDGSFTDLEVDAARGHIFGVAFSDGSMIVSTDAGQTFTEVTDPFKDSGGLYAVRLGPDGRVYISGGAGNAYVGEEDSGTWTWTKAAGRPARFGILYSILPLSPNEWYVAGGNNDSTIVAHTEDGGETWNLLPDGGFSATARDLLFHEFSGRLFMVGDLGTVQYSEDWGKTWHPVFWPSPYISDSSIRWREIAEDEEGEIWVVGEYSHPTWPGGTILTSQDGGNTWEYQEIYEYEFYCIELIGTNRIRIGGWYMWEGGIVYVSNNDGASFYHVEPEPSDGVDDMMFVSETTGWLVGQDYPHGGGIWKTTDSGITWQYVGGTPENGELCGLWMDENFRGLASGIRGTLAGTLDGDNWITILEPEVAPEQPTFNRLIRTRPGGFWIAGWIGDAAPYKPDGDGYILRRDGDWTQWKPDLYVEKRYITNVKELGKQVWATGFDGMLLKRPLRPKPETLAPTAPR